ncbi:hypothetical protein [Cupriavidus sp. UYPR2.512]|uniref:hypothetical protein n=1 Tax=Cupriavidus sp. UYPR2.512 TaxID=1080187 RepID=UPI00036E2F95|nr:hypothetical protein [Cupriavidus sp. UYPR2.512]UIF85429.1 hypothetical protein KAF44_15145 [Cupriavidus necator]
MIVKSLLRIAGIDPAIAYVILGKGWTVLAGIASLVLVARHLTGVEQGFFYTFASLLALQIFFELGFGGVIAQFAAHEMAHLTWRGRHISGDAICQARLYSLLWLAARWYGLIAVLMFLVVFPAGIWFFNASPTSDQVNWLKPWLVLVLCSCGNLALSPIISFFEGCGLVAKVARMRLLQSIVSNVLAWTVLLLGGRLWTTAASAAAMFAIGLIWLSVSLRPLLSDIIAHKRSAHIISWRQEIWPLQWRIAVSWLSGYFVFQIFNPIIFRFHGAEAAGQVGMSIAICNTLSAFAMSWVATKAPRFGDFIAKKKYDELDALYKSALLKSFVMLVIASIALLVTLYGLSRLHVEFANRILEPVQFLPLIAAMLANHIISSQATYARAHKQEPYLAYSVVMACLVGPASYLLGRYFSVSAMFGGYATILCLVGLAYSSRIIKQFRLHRI